MSRKPAQTLADYVIVAISPALIMLLVGSLMFFLTNIFYDGQFPGRLRFATALFVIAAVLIGRLSIDGGREYASLFAIPLAIVTIMSVLRYTDAGILVALPLIVAIWWSADKLTWDCTVIDDRKDASGEGLLQTVGLDADSNTNDAQSANTEVPEATTSSDVADAATAWQRWAAKRRRHHTPGVWIVFFCLASLPLFAVGQWLLPDQAAVRRSSFQLLCVYVASALALLMTTSFLQLRRYLRQRRLQMPSEMAGVWLGTGGLMIVALMIVCMFLPRPNTETSVIDFVTRVSSRDDLHPSRYAVGNERSENENASPAANDPESERTGEGDEGSDNGQNGSEAPSNQAGEQSGDRTNDDSSGNEESWDGSESNTEAANSEEDSAGADGRGATASNRKVARPQESPTLSSALQNLSREGFIKSVYWLVIGGIVALLAIRYRQELATAVRSFLRDLAALWARLTGRKRPVTESVIEDIVEPVAPRRPFSAYRDPFVTGLAEQYSNRQLVQYTFEALEAWAHERNCQRLADQTPLEFAMRIHSRDEHVGRAARKLAALYNQAAYTDGALPSVTADQLRELWTAMQAA